MRLRIGISRQQYQHIESKGNPRLNTLELVAKGLKSELMLIPVEKLSLINAILQNETSSFSLIRNEPPGQSEENRLADDPWKDFLKDIE